MAIPKQREKIITHLDDHHEKVRPVREFRLHRPKAIEDCELDAYLESGWYRQGQGMFSTYATISRRILMAAPWIRVPTFGYSLSKNLRRLRNKNGNQLTHHIGQANITPYREEMFQFFRQYFKGEFYESLDSALFCYRSQPGSIFDSREITFYRNGRLVGYSYFDVGQSSIASILNIYDYEHMKYSLGMYSILLQLEWCQENGIEYYYPGYAMPENPRFDYKLRIDGVEFLDQATGEWRPWDEFQLEETPLYEYRSAMVRAKEKFRSLDLGWRIGVYLNHSNPCPMLIDENGVQFLSHPIFLAGDIYDDPNPLIVDYDLDEKVYRLHRCTAHARPPFPDNHIKLEEILFPVDFDVADFGCVALLTLDQLLCKTDNLIELYQEIRKHDFVDWDKEV